MDVQSIMKELLSWFENCWGDMVNWFDNCWGDMVNWFDNCWGDMVSWLEKVFPPETRGEKLHHWLQVGAIFLIAVLVLIFFIYCCRCCCRGGRGRPIKMMKAPGRNYRMPRNIFESNPRSYFRNLRANPSYELC